MICSALQVYAVCRGRSTGIFSTWKECQQQIHQFSGAIFKSFQTRSEAENYLKEHGQTANVINHSQKRARDIKPSNPEPRLTSSSSKADISCTYTIKDEHPCKRSRFTRSEDRILSHTSCSTSGLKTGIIIKENVSSSSSREKVVVYTD